MGKEKMLETSPGVFIERYAAYLRTRKDFVVPASLHGVKTGVGKKLPPEDPEWAYTRAASIVRFVYLSGENGVTCGMLRRKYGCKKDRGTKPERRSLGSGAVVRRLMQALGEINVLELNAGNRRVVKKEGVKEIETITKECSVYD
ncbi:MAG: 40S ribosomal protein S19 [Amphiamblys sp. WSBS2006]|nr:MAG: 40S ribosomal protein S19 [Amphiamblys sp. WSBS2006]